VVHLVHILSIRVEYKTAYNYHVYQGRQCTYNVTVRRVRWLLLPWKSNKYYIVWVCVYKPYLSSMKNACPLLYWHLWAVWLYHSFPHYFINGTILGRKIAGYKMCVLFSVQLLPETFLILRRMEREIIINVHRSSCTVYVILVRL
jgi:hypothetical protein